MICTEPRRAWFRFDFASKSAVFDAPGSIEWFSRPEVLRVVSGVLGKYVGSAVARDRPSGFRETYPTPRTIATELQLALQRAFPSEAIEIFSEQVP